MTRLLRRVLNALPTAGSILVVVLIASTAVAALLAYQAITAARQRRAVSEGMLRQYAELALWEFSRQARRDIDSGLMQALASYAHPGRVHAGEGACDCGSLETIDQYFEIWPGGEIRTRSGAVDVALRDEIAKFAGGEEARGRGEGPLKLAPLRSDRTRFIATKWEPHVGAAGGHVGLVASAAALTPILTRTYRRSALLPAVLVNNRDARSFVDASLVDAGGDVVFASQTHPGPYVVESAFLPDLPIGLTARFSMTPEFIATLGPAHGAGPGVAVVVALVALNALLVGVGLWQLARERELARLRSDFVAGVSHELRTPLAQIRMFSETLLLDRVRNGSERRRALEIIGHESQRLSQLVDNVLHFHRQRRPVALDSGSPIDLVAFVREVVESFQPLASSRRVRVVLSSEVDELPVRGDEGTLRQVLLNLLDNAVKFGPTDQTVTLGLRSSDDVAVVTVEDQGSGVAVDERNRIFDPFERGQRTQGTGGAGIGLAVVWQIVMAHRGRVEVGEAPGGGARFTVSLPAAPDTDEADSSSRIAG